MMNNLKGQCHEIVQNKTFFKEGEVRGKGRGVVKRRKWRKRKKRMG
jgi:hypothetical protein